MLSSKDLWTENEKRLLSFNLLIIISLKAIRLDLYMLEPIANSPYSPDS